MGSLKDFLKECCKLLQLDKQQRRGKMIFAQHCPPAQQPISSYLCGGGTWRSDAQASHEAPEERRDPFRTYANLYMNVPSGSSVMRSDSGCGCSESECTAYRTSLGPLRRATGPASTSYGYLGDYVGGRQFTASSSGYCGSDHMQSLSEDAAYWSQEGKLRSIVSSRFSNDFSGYVGAVKGKNNAGRETSHYVTYAGLLKDVDLFNIGAQVARGMEHLRKMKVRRHTTLTYPMHSTLLAISIGVAFPSAAIVSLSPHFHVRHAYSVSTVTWQPGMCSLQTASSSRWQTLDWPETQKRRPTTGG